jgi:hypothetical protein
MLWYSSNVGALVIRWVVQMIAMLTFSGVLAGTAWQIRESHSLRAFIAGTALLISVVAFIIPKFIAIRSIPQMVYGLLYHILFPGVMTENVITANVGGYAESIGILLLISVISMAVYFRMQRKEASNA